MKDETKIMLVSASETETKYDNACKKLFSNKEIIAPILQFIVPEFKNLSVKEVIDCIDKVSNVTHVSDNIQIPMDNTEMNSLTESLVTYDIHFRTLNPKLTTGKIKVQLHIDLEIQNEYYVGYPLVKRGIYYVARELSSQFSIITKDTDYSHLEKCYSIWICNEKVPKRLQNTVKSFKIKETNIIGNPKAEQESNYDLMEVIFIYRSSDEMQNSHLLKNKDIFDYLSSVFSGDVERISDYTDDVNRENIKKEVMAMTGLGESIRKKAIAEGELKILNELVQDGILTLEEAAKRVHMTVDEFLQKLNAILEHDDK